LFYIAHPVICRICRTKFDRDKIAYVSPKDKVYNHADCYLRERVKNPSLPELKIIDPNDIVTCVYCKQSFNKKEVEYKLVLNNKYAHIPCAELEEKREKTDAEKLDLYIIELFKIDYVSPRIRKQINSYINEYNYTYTGILKALKYFYEIKKHSIDKSQNGIIVPYIKEYTDGGYQNREWSYYRSTPVVTISPNGSTSFTMSNFGYQRVDSTGYDPVYHTITSVENGTFDGLTVYPIDKNADVIISKGQGNFESLYGEGVNPYFIFLCKCELFVRRFQLKQYESVFMKEERIKDFS